MYTWPWSVSEVKHLKRQSTKTPGTSVGVGIVIKIQCIHYRWVFAHAFQNANIVGIYFDLYVRGFLVLKQTFWCLGNFLFANDTKKY